MFSENIIIIIIFYTDIKFEFLKEVSYAHQGCTYLNKNTGGKIIYIYIYIYIYGIYSVCVCVCVCVCVLQFNITVFYFNVFFSCDAEYIE